MFECVKLVSKAAKASGMCTGKTIFDCLKTKRPEARSDDAQDCNGLKTLMETPKHEENHNCSQSLSQTDVYEQLSVPQYTDRQRYLLRLSWSTLKDEIYHVGVVTFIRLFEHKLEYKRSFSKFANMSSDELRNSPVVRMHAMSVLHVIEQLVDRLDNIELWEGIIEEIAKRHAGFDAKPDLASDVASQCWRSIEPVLREHGKYDAETEQAWLALIKWLASAMGSRIRAAQTARSQTN